MGQSPNINVSFDIRDVGACRSLADHHELTERDDDLTAGDIEDGLRALVEHLGPQPWMTWRHGAFLVPVGAKSILGMGAGEAAQLGLDLAAVAGCAGFQDLLSGFRNPTQFEDSMFEARAARWCLGRKVVNALHFSPPYEVRGHLKRPDFHLHTTKGLLVCECKRLHVNKGELVARLSKITSAFERAAARLDAPKACRIEVEVVGRVDGDLDHRVFEACTQVLALPAGHSVRSGPFELLTSEVGRRPSMDHHWTVQTGRIPVGESVVGATSEYTNLLVSSPWMEKAVSRAMGALINSALAQLPEEHTGLALVSGNPRHGVLAAQARISTPAYNHCLAIAVSRGDGFEFVCRTSDETTVQEFTVPGDSE